MRLVWSSDLIQDMIPSCLWSMRCVVGIPRGDDGIVLNEQNSGVENGSVRRRIGHMH